MFPKEMLPVLLSSSKTAIRLHNGGYINLTGVSPVEWNESTLRLVQEFKKVRLIWWLSLQVTGSLVYGIGVNAACLFLETGGSTGIKMINKVISLVLLVLSIVGLGIGRKICDKADEIVCGINGLLDYQESLINSNK